jgi:pantoate--beta-alanine ligase
MQIIRGVAELQAWSDRMRCAGKRVALVPTMGALHEGHLSLVRLALQRAERVITSIFVNPTQFGAGEDFEIYPRDLDGDAEQLRRAGCDVVFAPSVEEMYPSGWSTWVDVQGLTDGLCGQDRPGHFRGVTTVVSRLLNAAKPDVAVFGEKDWQQLAIIRRMARDLLWGVEIVGGPIVREPDGVAMSSRNQNLSADERRQARALNAALIEARRLAAAGESRAAALEDAARRRIAKEPLARIDYVEVVDPETLVPLEQIRSTALMALAVRFSKARLIDNALLEVG